MGTPRDDLRPDLRQYTYKGYIILYSVTENDDVLVQAIIRGGRDLDALFGS